MKALIVSCLLACGVFASGISTAVAHPGSEAMHRALEKKERDAANKSARKANDDGSRPQRKAATKPAPAKAVASSGTGQVLTGIASYYWQPQPVASGGRFNPEAMTAAHKTLPFGTRVRVTRADNGRSVDVVINDRGPYIAGRIIDLSRRAARDIGMTDIGITRVKVTVLGRG